MTKEKLYTDIDGTWRKVYGYDVLVDGSGSVRRCTKMDRTGGVVPASPYRFDKRLGCWTNVLGCKFSTLRRGMSSGAYDII